MNAPALARALWPRRLYHQLLLMVSLSLLLALGLLGGYTASEQSAVALRGFESQAAALARNLAIASSNAILTDSIDQVEELVQRSADFKEVLALQVLTPDGRNISHVVRPLGQPAKLVFDAPSLRAAVPGQAQPQVITDEACGQLVAWHPIMATRLIGWVRLDYSAESLLEVRGRIWRGTLLVAVLAISLCAGLISLMLRRPMRALNRARQFAIELANAEGRQMPYQPGPIEVVELDAALNEASMLLCQQLVLIEDGRKKRAAHEARLAEQNAQLGAIFAMSPDGLVTFNREGRVQFANQAFLSLTGLQADDVVGHSEAQLDAILLERAAKGSTFTGLQACVDHAGLAEQANPKLIDDQVLMLRSTPTVLTLRGRRSAVGAVSLVLYVCDVSKQHRLDKMKSEFLSMAAHELRTPMVSIFGFTELMLVRKMDDAKREELLGRIHRQSKSMMAIINELLDLARIEARRGQDFVFETIDLVDVARAVVADFRPPEGRESPVLTLPDGPLPVHIDCSKMQQAVLNILSNAYKYSPQGGPVQVRFLNGGPGQGRQRFAIQIEDVGLGLSPEHLARLGERFFRADQSGNIPGTGLGVSIVKELMDLMGGRMEVASELGRGTTVTLWL